MDMNHRKILVLKLIISTSFLSMYKVTCGNIFQKFHSLKSYNMDSYPYYNLYSFIFIYVIFHEYSKFVWIYFFTIFRSLQYLTVEKSKLRLRLNRNFKLIQRVYKHFSSHHNFYFARKHFI